MRKWIALFTAISLLLFPLSVRAESEYAGQPPTEASGKNESLRLLSALYEEQTILVYSPLSLSVALGMAMEGAAGETEAQLSRFLGGKAPGGFALEDIRFSGAELVNTAFLRSDFTLIPAYEEALSDRYDAAPVLMEEGNVMNQVNEWVSEHTDGLIEDFLSEEPDSMTKMLLINALSFRGEWASPFDPANTGFSVFHSPEGDVEVSSMRQTASFKYSETDELQSIILPYRDSALEMLILLPKDGCLQSLVDQVCESPDDFIQQHLPAEKQRVHLSLPNIYAESSFELKDALAALGIVDAFDPHLADFSRMAENAAELDLHIGSVLQKTVLKVNEIGTEAAAATQVSMAARGALMDPPVEMKIDRPFMILIHDPASGYVLFAACINNPA